LWAWLNPIVPSAVGNYFIPLYVMMEVGTYRQAGWQRYYMPNVTIVERQADGSIILWGHVYHPWGTSGNETFSALRITYGGAQLNRRTNAGAWTAGDMSGMVTAGTLTVRG